MKISMFTGGMVQTNGYLVETIDGNYLVDAPDGVFDWLNAKGVRLDALYLTHQHYDHVEDVAKIQKSGVKVQAWADYSKHLTLEAIGASWGMPDVEPYRIDKKITEGESRFFQSSTLVNHVPGHSPDSVTFYIPEAGVVFSGDALFAGSIGRCDLPGGDADLLISGIREKLLILPDDTKVFPGHGPSTTIGREKMTNGYLR
jgi:hydroxyacylglutathione hydrolase